MKKKPTKKKNEKKPQPKARAKTPQPKAKRKIPSQSSTENNQLVLSFPGTISPMALMLHPAMAISVWSNVGIQLRKVKEFIQFAIGDWLNHGEAHYGEMYSQAATETGLPEETLMILKHVASRVAPEDRVSSLTWSHHREVAKFPPEEQTKWLKKAAEKAWSVRELKDAIKKASGKSHDRDGDGKEEDGKPVGGEACEACGSSPADMIVCGSCLAFLANNPKSKGASVIQEDG